MVIYNIDARESSPAGAKRKHAHPTLRDNLMKHAAIVLLLAATAEALMLGTPASAVSRRCRLVSASTAPLLNALAETGPVGVDASEEQQTSIESLASALDGTGEDAAQARVPLKGTYDLMYSMAKGGSNGKVDSHWQPSHWQPSHWQPSHWQPSHWQPSHWQPSHWQPQP